MPAHRVQAIHCDLCGGGVFLLAGATPATPVPCEVCGEIKTSGLVVRCAACDHRRTPGRQTACAGCLEQMPPPASEKS